jgi:hypothetical protein
MAYNFPLALRFGKSGRPGAGHPSDGMYSRTKHENQERFCGVCHIEAADAAASRKAVTDSALPLSEPARLGLD